MSKSPKHALWLRPFGDTAFKLKRRIKDLSHTFDTPYFEPHVTLQSDLHNNKTELIQMTDALAGSLTPFEIRLTTIGYQDNYFRSLYINVERSESLMIAHRTTEQLFGCNTAKDYIPHLSLLYGDIPRREKEKLVGRMDPEFNLSFLVHSVLLIKTEGDVSEWEKVHTAEFSHHRHVPSHLE